MYIIRADTGISGWLFQVEDVKGMFLNLYFPYGPQAGIAQEVQKDLCTAPNMLNTNVTWEASLK